VPSKVGDIGKISVPAMWEKILVASSVEGPIYRGTDFIQSVADLSYSRKGWPKSTFAVSMMLVTRLVEIIAKDPKNLGVTCNACCPGWVPIDMGGEGDERSIPESADMPVWLATTDEPEVVQTSGGFFAKWKKLKFSEGVEKA
jgi:NAD(P)-dependent dehydrogenase (short-subunit alcohol dehydrogenase family)